MASPGLVGRLLAILEPLAAERGIDIVDLEVVGSGKAPCVRIRIDHVDEAAPTITLDEVAEQTRWISAALDEADPIEGAFTLEVSSPGLDRPLRRQRDFVRFAGNRVTLKTVSGDRSRYTGLLRGWQDGRVVIECDGEQFSFAPDEIASAKIKPTF